MMGRHNRDQEQLFYSFCLDEAVPADHHVRAIAAVLDLSWVHIALASYYPKIGRPSIDPVLMIRMLIVGYVFALRAERALCREVQQKPKMRVETKSTSTVAAACHRHGDLRSKQHED